MIILTDYSFLIIFLAIGFGVGYWILTTANIQERHLEIAGIIMGWILIAMTLIIALINSYSSINLAGNSFTRGGCPFDRSMRHKMPVMQQENKQEMKEEMKEEKSEPKEQMEQKSPGDRD